MRWYFTQKVAGAAEGYAAVAGEVIVRLWFANYRSGAFTGARY